MSTRTSAAAVLALAAVLAACGASATPSPAPTTPAPPLPTPTATPLPTPSPTPAQTAGPTLVASDIRAIIEGTAAIGSARIEFGVGLYGSSSVADGDILTGAGQFGATEPLKARFQMDMSAAGLGLLEMIQDGETILMRGGAFEVWAPDGKWLLVDTSSDHPNVEALGGSVSQDPWSALFVLLGATGATELVETSTIDGDAVDHLRFEVDLDLAVDRAPASQRDALLVQVANMRQQAAVGSKVLADLWVDAQDRIRRAEYTLTRAPIVGGGTMQAWYEFSDFGITVELPEIPDDEIVNIEDIDLG